jgi:hypothetical protein
MNQGPLSALLNLPVIAQVRRNHALEHATLQVLSERNKALALMGRSSLWGFYIYGNVDTEEVLDAAREGLRRLKAGERGMAIHPTCGSNYVVAGAMSRNRREGFLERLARLPLAWAIGTLGAIVSRPLGGVVQAYITTKAEVGDLRIDSVFRNERAGTVIHFVRTEG